MSFFKQLLPEKCIVWAFRLFCVGLIVGEFYAFGVKGWFYWGGFILVTMAPVLEALQEPPARPPVEPPPSAPRQAAWWIPAGLSSPL